jgi:hypothetical protein
MNDPLVKEVRQFRHEHAQQFHGDLTAICEDLREIQRTCGQPVVTLSPKRLPTQSRPRQNSEAVEEVAA